jgi:hypothetical protein
MKIVDFLKQPFTTTLLCVVGLTGGFLLGIGSSKLIVMQDKELQKNKACKEAYKIMCVQVHACTGSSVEECDQIVEKEELCKTNLPDSQVISSCEEELRHVECTDQMPTSCTLFME